MWYKFCRASASSKWQRVDAVFKLRISFKMNKKVLSRKILLNSSFFEAFKKPALGQIRQKVKIFHLLK